MFNLNVKLEINEDSFEEFKFEDVRIQNFYNDLYKHDNGVSYLYHVITDTYVDESLEETGNLKNLEEFLSEVKQYFILDRGSGGDDYPECYEFFNSLDEVNEYLKSYDVYNYKNLFIYNLLNSKKLKCDLKYNII